MNTDNGALEFDSYFNNERLIKSVNEAKKSVKDFTDSTVTEGEKIDDAFKITAENIRIQKDVIVQLEGQLNNLNIEISKVKPGSGQTILKQQAAEVTAELNAEKNALKMLQSQVEKTETAHSSYRSQLMALREEMIKMEGAGLRDSPEYRRLQVRAGELKDAIGDAQQQMKVLADDERVFKGVVSTISGVTGAFSAAQGAVGLFAGENENLNKIMLKVQSLMAITIGLQQVGEMLNKDSYFSVVVLTKAKELMAVAELKLATAFGISTVAAQVLMATLTLGLSVAITAIIVAISKLSSSSAAAKKEMNELIKSTSDMAAKPVATVEQLAIAWSKLGDNIKEKEKFIKDNADKFKELGVNVNGVNDAEQIFVKNKDKFIESLILRAKAMATSELAAQKYKEAIQKQLEADKTPEKNAIPIMVGSTVLTSFNMKSNKKSNLQKEATDLETAGNDLFKKAAEFSEKENEIIKGLGLSAENIAEGSIAALEDSISKLKEKYKNATTDKERNKLLKDIKEQEKVLEKMDLLNAKKPSKDNSLKEANNKLIKDFEDNMQEEIRAANSVLDVMAIIEKKKSELKGDGSDVDKGKKEALDKAERDARIRATEETDKLLEDYATFLSAKLRLQQQYNEDMFLLQQRLDSAAPEQKEAIQGAMTRRTEKYNKDSKLSGDSEYDTLVASYRNFEQKKQAINDEFEEKKRKAMQFNNKVLLDELTKQQADSISELVSGELMNSEDWKKLFGNLDRLTVDELLKLKDKIESQFGSLDLNPEDLSEIRDKLNDVTDQIQKKNPFKALEEALKSYKKEANAENLSQVWDDVAAAVGAVKDIYEQVVASLKDLGLETSEGTDQVLKDVSGILEGGQTLATGIASNNPLQIVQGAIDIISNGIDLIAGGKDRKLERSIQKHAEAVENLKKNYEELEKAIDKALGSDKYNQQKNIIDNLKKQQQEYTAMIQAENEKKKKDGSKLTEYIDGIEESKGKIKEVIDSVREEILTTSVASIAEDLGNAIFDAFAAGEDAAVAWGKKVDEVVGNVIKKMLIQKLVEEPVGQIINKYMAKWVDGDGNFLGFDAVMQTAMQMGDELAAIGPGLSSLMNSLPDEIKKYLFGTGKDDNATLSGQIKGASEETVNLLAGYANAIRLNQLEQIIVIRQQLFHLSEIAANTRYNKHLESIDQKIGALASDPLRSQGL